MFTDFVDSYVKSLVRKADLERVKIFLMLLYKKNNFLK